MLIWEFTEKLNVFLEGMRNQYIGGELPKKSGLAQFADLRG